MSLESRKLNVGDYALTDYNSRPNNSGRILTMVQITAVKNGNSQSGIMFQVTPKLKNSAIDSWYDADWFEVVMKGN